MNYFTRIARCAASVSKRSFLLALCSLSVWQARSQVSVTATAATTGPTTYTTLKGAFDAVNTGTHQGSVTITITANTTETAAAVLNGSGSGGALYTAVLVKPGTGATPVVSGSVANVALIKLNGASNVTIEGSNNGTTSRDLTFSNTSATAPSVLHIGSVATTSITGDTVRNTILINGVNTSTAVALGDAAVLGGAGYFTNVAFQNNSIQKAYIGMYLNSVPLTTNGSGTLVANNDLNTSGTNALRLCGVYVQGLNNATIANNNIGNFNGASAEFDRGIWLATATNNTTVSGNTISGLSYTGASSYAPIGINVSPGVLNANIDVSGNTVTNITSAGTGTTMGIYFYSISSGITIQKNKVGTIKNTNSGGYGSVGIYLSGTNTTSNTNVLNNFVWDVTGIGYNGWTIGDNGNGMVVDAGGGYNIYYNTIALTTNQTLTAGNRAAALLITDGVTAANSINLRNNILANFQTVGNANSRFALAVTAANNVFSSFNYNDYYATSGNLATQGSNATIWNTIAQIQTNMTGNANSTAIQPVFTSLTDLHLPFATNAGLNNTGLSIPAITTDIDGDPRTATPDMGADEFGNCSVVTFNTQPASTAICAGANTTFTVAATGGTSYQWQANTGSGFANISNGGVYGGATTASLTITNATTAMNGTTYQVLVGTGVGCPPATSSVVTLTVNPLPVVTVTASGPLTFCAGDSVVLSAPTGANLTYQWKNASGNISGATASTYAAKATGSYTVLITNTSTTCNATSTATAVTVNPAPVTTITAGGTTTFCPGSNVVLSVPAGANLTYQWMNGGVNISGATTNTYTATGAGSYTVLVTNTTTTCAATTVTPVVVTMSTGPVAVISPAGNVNVCTGSSTTLSAGSTAGLTYQWQLNGTNITGATANTYSANAAGSYTVIVSAGPGCSTTSAPTTVTIIALPTATATPTGSTTACQGSTVTLTANSGTGLTYKWQLNGSTITGATAITYNAAATGNYTVVVTNTSTTCQNTSAPVAITINPLPVVTTTPSGTVPICTGNSVVLTANATGVTYQWLLNGTPITGATTSTYTANAAGSYTVRVTSTTTTCQNTSAAVVVTTNAVPTATITPSGTQAVCQGDSALLQANSGTSLSYQWYLNTVLIPGATNINYKAGVAGSYTVNVSVGTSCSTLSSAVTVTINPLPAATITAAGPITFCQGGSVALNANVVAGYTYQWQQGTAPVVPANTTTTYTANATGSYTVIVTNPATLCANKSNAIAVTVNALPTATITPATSTTLCAGNSVVLNANTGTGFTYQWSNASGIITGATAASYTANTAGAYTVKVTNTNTCSATSLPVTVIVNPLPPTTVTPTGPVNLCSGSTLALAGPTGTGLTYQWKLGSTNAPGTSNTINYNATAAGSYTLVVTTAAGCTGTSAPTVVTILPLPTAAILPTIATTGCDSVVLTSNSPGVTYQWNLGTAPIVGATNSTYSAVLTGNYSVTVTSIANGCTAKTAAVAITVNPSPAGIITYTSPIIFCEGGAVVLNTYSGNNLAFEWRESSNPITGENNTSYIATTTGSYTVKVTNTATGCARISDPLQVRVNPLPVPVVTYDPTTNQLSTTQAFMQYQWYNNTQPVPGATHRNHTPASNGAYGVTVVDSNGCTSSPSPITFVNGVGIVNPQAAMRVKVYPNPSTGVLHIDAPMALKLVIRDITGKAVLHADNVSTVNIENLADGMYLLYISNTAGQLIKAEKITKSSN